MIRRRGTIDNTNDILDAWIMVEHLSEGEINLRDILLLDDFRSCTVFGYLEMW